MTWPRRPVTGATSLVQFVRVGQPQAGAVALRTLARAAGAEDGSARSARLYGAAHALCPIELAPDKDEASTHAHVLAALRAELGDAALPAAMVAGGRLSLEQPAAKAADQD